VEQNQQADGRIQAQSLSVIEPIICLGVNAQSYDFNGIFQQMLGFFYFLKLWKEYPV